MLVQMVKDEDMFHPEVTEPSVTKKMIKLSQTLEDARRELNRDDLWTKTEVHQELIGLWKQYAGYVPMKLLMWLD